MQNDPGSVVQTQQYLVEFLEFLSLKNSILTEKSTIEVDHAFFFSFPVNVVGNI